MAEGLGNMIVDDDLPDDHEDARDDDDDVENGSSRMFASKSHGRGIQGYDDDGKVEGQPEIFGLAASLD